MSDDQTKTLEKPHISIPLLNQVYDGLWIGNIGAARDDAILHRCGITQTLNLAVNADTPPLTLRDGTVVRRAKIGLIDGTGNTLSHMIAAIMAVEGMLQQVAPGKPTYPDHREGGLLVHCRAGRSRSVSVVAAHLVLSQGERFPSLDAALMHLRKMCELNETYPKTPMVDLASAAIMRLTE